MDGAKEGIHIFDVDELFVALESGQSEATEHEVRVDYIEDRLGRWIMVVDRFWASHLIANVQIQACWPVNKRVLDMTMG